MNNRDFPLFFKSLLFISLLIVSTIDLQADEIEKIKSTITGYNNGIIYASKTDKSDHLKAYANEKIVMKFHLWLKSWHDNNLFMDAKIDDIAFKKIDFKDKKAIVITQEKWIYRYIDIKTKKEVQSKTKIDYKMRYELSKPNLKWIIQKIDVLSEKKSKNDL